MTFSVYKNLYDEAACHIVNEFLMRDCPILSREEELILKNEKLDEILNLYKDFPNKKMRRAILDWIKYKRKKFKAEKENLLREEEVSSLLKSLNLPR